MDESRENKRGSLDLLRELSKKLIETESELNAFFHLCPVLFSIVRRDPQNIAHFHKVNMAWVDLLGYTAEELCSRPVFDFIHPDDIEKSAEARALLLSGKPLINFTSRWRAKDGTYKNIMWRASPYLDGEYTYTTAFEVP